MELGEIIKLTIGSVLVIIAAYYATVLVAKRRRSAITGREILIRERVALSKDQSVCVVESRGRAYLVIITNGNATVLDSYEVPETQEAGQPESGGFTPTDPIQRAMWNGLNKLKNKRRKDDFSGVFERAAETETTEVPGDRVKKPGPLSDDDNIDALYKRVQSRRYANSDRADRLRGDGDE